MTLLNLAVHAALLAAASSAPGPRLERRYSVGETARYRIEGRHSTDGIPDHAYSALAVSTAMQDRSGVFYEEIQWRDVRHDGSPVPIPPKMDAFRQNVSLDTRYKQRVPDLSIAGRYLVGPITDLLTFYVDGQLAYKDPLQVGQTVMVPYGKPSSWADGHRVLVGYDCIDFQVSLLTRTEKEAVVRVRHVPTAAVCGSVPADWMHGSAAAPNNWFQVMKTPEDGYEAAAGVEVFDVELRLSIPSGSIIQTQMHNPVEFEERRCRDAALTRCDPPVKHRILREIILRTDEGARP